MTNMAAEPAPFWPFGVTLVAICIPFFSIIGFLSTKYGYSMWAAKTAQVWRWLRPKKDVKDEEGEGDEWEVKGRVSRTLSTEEGMRLRAVRERTGGVNSRVKSHPNIQRMVERMGEGRESGLKRMGTLGDEDGGRTSKDTVINVRET